MVKIDSRSLVGEEIARRADYSTMPELDLQRSFDEWQGYYAETPDPEERTTIGQHILEHQAFELHARATGHPETYVAQYRNVVDMAIAQS